MLLTVGGVVRVVSFSIDLVGAKKLQVETSDFDCIWESLTPAVEVVGCLHLLSASYANQLVLAPSPLSLTTSYFFQLNP
jgi:hypothetical protein